MNLLTQLISPFRFCYLWRYGSNTPTELRGLELSLSDIKWCALTLKPLGTWFKISDLGVTWSLSSRVESAESPINLAKKLFIMGLDQLTLKGYLDPGSGSVEAEFESTWTWPSIKPCSGNTKLVSTKSNLKRACKKRPAILLEGS